MSQSTPNQSGKQNIQGEELSFESISDIEGRYREQAEDSSSSSSSSQTDLEPLTDDSDDNGSKVLTPSAAKLIPQPTKFDTRKKKEQLQLDDANDREMKNMLSLWKAQRRARELQEELDKELNQDNDDSVDVTNARYNESTCKMATLNNKFKSRSRRSQQSRHRFLCTA